MRRSIQTRVLPLVLRRVAGRVLTFEVAIDFEKVTHVVVTLVTGVLVHRTFRLYHRNLCAPRACPRRRIIHGELVEDGVGVDPSKAFHHVQRFA